MAVEKIKKMSQPVDSKDKLAQVATISAGNNAQIGDLIADAMEKVGTDGVITVEESKSFGTNLKVVEGMQFDKGYISPYFVTDAERMEAVLKMLMFFVLTKNQFDFRPCTYIGTGCT